MKKLIHKKDISKAVEKHNEYIRIRYGYEWKRWCTKFKPKQLNLTGYDLSNIKIINDPLPSYNYYTEKYESCLHNLVIRPYENVPPFCIDMKGLDEVVFHKDPKTSLTIAKMLLDKGKSK